MQFLFGHNLFMKVFIRKFTLSFPLHKKVVLMVNKYPGNQITQVFLAVVSKRIGQEIVNIDNTTITIKDILFHIRKFPNMMFTVKFKNIRMHTKKEQIAGNFKFRFEFPPGFII